MSRSAGQLPWTDLTTSPSGLVTRAGTTSVRPRPGWLDRVVRRSAANWTARLGKAWRVLGTTPATDWESEIDHVLVGPAGVFAVSSKSASHDPVWVGGETVMVNGMRVSYVAKSRYDAARLSRLLSRSMAFRVPVTGLVVVTDSDGFGVREQPTDAAVRVLTPRAAARWLNRLPPRLSSGQVERLYAAADDPATWVAEHAPKLA